MVLYHVVTANHLLNAMTHHQVNPGCATLIISQWIREKYPHIHKLKQYFDKVIETDTNYRFSYSEEATNRYFSKLLGDIHDYSEIYLWGAQYSFGFYLADNGIPFTFCEEAPGILSRPHILEHIERDTLKKANFPEVQKRGLYNGSCRYTKRRMGILAAQTDDFVPDSSMVDFDAVSVLASLPEEDRKQIMGFFVTNMEIACEKNAVVLLTQHFANLKMLTIEEQMLIYQLFVDYFLYEDRLLIKPHPEDWIYYSRLFPGAQLIREKFPSEFIPFMLTNRPQCVATISSTATYSLRGQYSNMIELDTRYEKDFPATHRYFAAARLLKKLGKDAAYLGANDRLLSVLLKTEGSDVGLTPWTEGCKARVVVIDNVTEQGEEGRELVRRILAEMDGESCAILLNSQKDFCWYDINEKALWRNIRPLTLRKHRTDPNSEDFYANLDEETIYIYAKDEELRTMAQEVKIEKALPHTGITLESVDFSPEQEKIKMLEGILAATEKRLLYYIEKEKAKK